MRLAPYIISLCLHAAVFLLIVYWPASAPVRLESPPIMISLVEGAPGGARAPSAILGHMGEPADGELAPSAPAPRSEVAAPARESPGESRPQPVPPTSERPLKPEPKAIPVASKKIDEAPKPAKPKPEPEKAVKPSEQPKKETAKREAPKPDNPKKEEAKKDSSKKPAPKPRGDPVAEALKQARKATSRASSGDRGTAIEQALAQARKGAGGTRGGGGGEGEGPGGGGLGDVYMGQVMLAVRPNWGFTSGGRLNLACVVKVQVDMSGQILRAVISQSSGNAQYDASAVNAVIRTGQAGEFPPPPSPQYCDLDLVFTLNELMGR